MPTTHDRDVRNREAQRYVGHSLKWRSRDGQFAGTSPSGNWNGVAFRISRYLYSCGVDDDERRASLRHAYDALLNGRKSVKVIDVTIRTDDD